MAMSGGSDDGSPMMEMNTTPLIDVMLCMLIIFILSIPVATHAVNIDLPTPSDVPSDVNIDPVKNKVIITREGEILWNGETVTQGELVSTIQESLLLPVEPELQFEPDEFTAYEVTAEVLKIIKNSGATKFGFVGNERYRMFDAGPAGVNPTQTAT